jgi:hypothetical protein
MTIRIVKKNRSKSIRFSKQMINFALPTGLEAGPEADKYVVQRKLHDSP